MRVAATANEAELDSMAAEYLSTRYADRVTVYYTPELDAGGGRYGQDFVRLVAQRFGRVGRLLEWCAGPGFIGFSLLAHDLCESLVLTDLNPLALDACRETIARNQLAGRVRLYRSDNLDDIPPAEQWDLVVGNPPHSGSADPVPWLRHRPPAIYMDPGWQIHRRFFASVRGHLSPSGWIALVENRRFSSPDDFGGMIRAGGLELAGVEPGRYPGTDWYYYLLIRPAPDASE